MAPDERKRRMQRMRSAVQDNNVYRWAGKILSALLKVDAADSVGTPSGNGTAALGGRSVSPLLGGG